MTSPAARLRDLQAGPWPLILPNVWDPVSAQAFAQAGFPALATSSAAVAATLGYQDGQTPAQQMFAAIARIARSVGVPVTADVENGYGLDPAELAATLASCGVAGCNLEDSAPDSHALADQARQAEFLAAVRAAAGDRLVINARVDAYLRPSPAGSAHSGTADSAARDAAAAGPDARQDDAVSRANTYLAAGADCAYPILAPAAELPSLVKRIAGPVNAMYRPGGPDLAELAGYGIARITFGGGTHARAKQAIGELARELAAESGQVAPAR